jgi:Fe-S cluster biogenesis protein NfuA
MLGFRKEKHEPSSASPGVTSQEAAAPEGEVAPEAYAGAQVAAGSYAGAQVAAGSAEPSSAAADSSLGQGLAPQQAPQALPPQGAVASLSEEERAERLRELNELIDMVRPVIQQDGGDLLLLSADVEAGTVELQLQGACSSCAISATTLQAGVERILKDRLEWVREVSGGVDEDMDWYESAAMGRGAYVPKW